MANYETFFPENGSSHPFEQPYGGFTASGAYRPLVRDIAYPTDPLTANQLKKVSDKINTGAQTIEVSGLGLSGSGPMKHLASIPKQHWKEIDRLRQLTGVELTFHGPLVESSGFSRGTWSEEQRIEAEKQMKAAVELAQQMNSDKKDKKGVVMTFHSNNGLPEVERKVVVGRDKDGNPIEELVSMSVYNPWTGEIGALPFNARYNPFDRKNESVKDRFDEFNREKWNDKVEAVVVNNTRINREVIENLTRAREEDSKIKETAPTYQNILSEAYKEINKDYSKYEQRIKEIQKQSPDLAQAVVNGISSLQNADFFVRESYDQFKELYNQAHTDIKQDIKFAEKKEVREAKEKALKKLDKYAEELRNTFGKFEKEYNVLDLQNKINEGTRLLKDEDVRPRLYRPLKEFAIDKGSDTFANVALHAYQNAKKRGTSPGIISIENPPAGMSGLTRAEELAELIDKSRKKFVDNAVKNKLMSESEAKKTAEQIIGATWDVGHINSIQKWGYNKKEVLGQAKKIAPYVKHMHIADNLGFEDSELPIGMGNVPIDEILNNDWEFGENFRKAKKAIETGDWFSRQGGLGMSRTPMVESLSGLNAPVYSMGDAGSAYWNSAIMNDGGYFGGLGPINPEGHHSIYGAGFSQLPAYLGAEVPGKASNSSFSGSPLE